MKNLSILTPVVVLCLLAVVTVVQGDDPYLHAFAIDPSSVLDFTLTQYEGNSTAPADFIDSWSGSSGVSGTLGGALWYKSDASYSNFQLNTMDISADSIIGYSDWFYMDTDYGDTRAQVRVRDFNVTDAGVSGNSAIAGDGSFLIPNYPTLTSGYADIDVEYYLLFGWVGVPGYDPATEDISGSQTSNMSGIVGGTGNYGTISTTQQVVESFYFNESGASYTIKLDLVSTINATTQGTPTLLLHADAGPGTMVRGPAPGQLDAGGSYDPQSNVIVSYAWDLDGDGAYDDRTGISVNVTSAELSTLGLSYGDHTVGLKIVADDGYWATSETTLTYTTLLTGDANGDNVVSAGDYAAVQANFGNVGEFGILGDANGDGVVSAGDYASVQANFGNVSGTTIPEPSTMFLLGIGVLRLLRRRRKSA